MRNGAMRCLIPLVGFCLSLACLCGAETLVDEFPTSKTELWSFDNGGEFPGAKGSFEVGDAQKHNSLKADYCGKLHFDFSGGGAYVSAKMQVGSSVEKSENFTGLSLNLYKPEGVRVKIRLTDASGQTFQKEIRSVPDHWSTVSTTLDLWESSWGGKNDGVFHGAPTILAILADHQELPKGTVLFDDVKLLTGELSTQVHLTHSLKAWIAPNQWHLDGPGKTKLTSETLVLDFSGEGRSATLRIAERTLHGVPEKIMIRGKGSAEGLKIKLHFYTHFLTFFKEVSATKTDDGFEFVSNMPPGEDWKYGGGENDGKIHGPLRLGRMEFISSQQKFFRLEDFDIVFTSQAPSDSVLMQYAQSRENGEEIEFTWNGQSLSSENIQGKLLCTLKNWQGDILKEEERTVNLVGKLQKNSQTFSLPLPEKLHFVEALFTFSAETLRQEPVYCTWLGDFPKNDDFSKDLDSPFGMGVYLYRLPADQLDKVARKAAEAGVKWSREEFNWGMLEPRKGQYNWKFFDQVVSTAEKYGIQVYGILGYWSGWTKPYTEEGIQDYLNYVRACVTRYQGRINHWEIWNEPNIFFWQGPKEMYGEVLKRSYQLIKEIDPEIQVLGLSTAGIDLDFIGKMLQQEAPFDILTIHPYRSVLVEDSFFKDLKKADQAVQLADGTHRPIWNTEMGWATHTEHPVLRQDFVPNSERKQAEFLARTHLTTISSGINPKNFWYNFRNDGDDPWYFEFNMGITRQDFSPKPAYAVFSTLTYVLKGTQFANIQEGTEGTYIASFKGGDKVVMVLWNPNQSSNFTLQMGERDALENNTIQINRQKAHFTRALNAMGEEISLSKLATESNEVIALSKGAPIYLEFHLEKRN